MRDALRRYRLLPLLSLIGLLGALVRPSTGTGDEKKGEEKKGRTYAVVVGVRQYKKDELRPLKYADKDAAALAEALKGGGYRRVVLMTHESAAHDADLLPTARNIKEQLKSMAEDCEKEDTLVFAFAGHGVQFEGDKDCYLCPMNAELGEKRTLVALSDVYKELANCKAQTRLAVLDASHARPAAGGSARLVLRTRPQELEVPKGVLALFSCSPGQYSYESDRLKQGVFFHNLLKGLGGEAAGKDGKAIALDALVRYVQDEVPDDAKDDGGPAARQVPVLRGERAGRVVVLSEPAGISLPPGRREIVNSIGMKLVVVPKGKFTMGSPPTEPSRIPNEGPQHAVEISKPFLMGAYEVTQAQYQSVMGSNPSHFVPGGPGAGRVAGMDVTVHPVERVSYDEAVEFCKKLSDLPKEKAARRVYRLPTEAEWEYACRAGTTTAFSFGASASSSQANFDGDFPYNGGQRGPDLVRTTRVGSYPPNAWGLYDMHGNVQEWCSDWFDANAYNAGPRKDPRGPAAGTVRVTRGGSWTNVGHLCRAAGRAARSTFERAPTQGVRVVCVPQ